MTTNEVMILVLGIAVIAIVGFLLYRNWRTTRLRRRFGPEYDRLLSEQGDRVKAERELLARQRRIEKLTIRPLPRVDLDRFINDWRRVQVLFVDEPSRAVTEADLLVRKVMEARGYPMGDFEQRAADISVHYPRVVENYRLARNVTERNKRGEANTEDLRQALVYFRALFVELLETQEPRASAQEKKVEKEVRR